MYKNNKGFTLIELMTVVAIIAILAGISTLTIVKQLPSRNLVKASRDMVSTFRKARSMAIKLNQPVSLRFDEENNKYILSSARIYQEYTFPSRTIKYGFPGRSKDAVTFPGGMFVFNPLGMTDSIMPAEGLYVYMHYGDIGQQHAGYRIGIKGMAANVVMEKCGSLDNTGKTITCLE